MSDLLWNRWMDVRPEKGRLVEVIFADGRQESGYKYAGGVVLLIHLRAAQSVAIRADCQIAPAGVTKVGCSPLWIFPSCPATNSANRPKQANRRRNNGECPTSTTDSGSVAPQDSDTVIRMPSEFPGNSRAAPGRPTG